MIIIIEPIIHTHVASHKTKRIYSIILYIYGFTWIISKDSNYSLITHCSLIYILKSYMYKGFNLIPMASIAIFQNLICLGLWNITFQRYIHFSNYLTSIILQFGYANIVFFIIYDFLLKNVLFQVSENHPICIFKQHVILIVNF